MQTSNSQGLGSDAFKTYNKSNTKPKHSHHNKQKIQNFSLPLSLLKSKKVKNLSETLSLISPYKCLSSLSHLSLSQQQIRTRQTIREFLIEKGQVKLTGQYVLYEYLVSLDEYDLYRAICLKTRSKVVIRIQQKILLFDEKSKRKVLKTSRNESSENLESNSLKSAQSNQQQQKQKKQQQTQKFMLMEEVLKKTQGIFLTRCQDTLESNLFKVFVLSNFYGERLDKFIQRKGSLLLSQALAVFKQIILGCSQLRKNGIQISHIRLQNIIFCNGMFRIFDFHQLLKPLSQSQSQNQLSSSQTSIQKSSAFSLLSQTKSDLQYQQLLFAPELRSHKHLPKKVDQSSASVIWSLAVVFYIMICSDQEYQNRIIDLKRQLKQKHFNFKLKDGSNPVKDVLFMLTEMLNENSQERLTWAQLFKLQIFENQYFTVVKQFPLVDPREKTMRNCFLAKLGELDSPQIIKKQIDNIQDKQIDLYKQATYQEQTKERKQQLTQDKQQTSYTSKIDKPQQKLEKLVSSQKKEKQQLNQTNQLTFQLIQDKKYNINPHKFKEVQQSIYQNLQQYNLNILKAQYLFNHIVLPIQQYGLINNKRRSHMQMFYLICSRCWFYVSKANCASNINDKRAQNYNDQIKNIYISVRTKFYSVFKRLNKVDNSTYYVSNDLLSGLMKGAKINQKQKFLSKGKEGVSYSTQQHVYFTQDNYIDKIMPEMKGQPKMLQQVRNTLDNYDKINQIRLQQIQGKLSFSEIVEKIIQSK